MFTFGLYFLKIIGYHINIYIYIYVLFIKVNLNILKKFPTFNFFSLKLLSSGHHTYDPL